MFNKFVLSIRQSDLLLTRPGLLASPGEWSQSSAGILANVSRNNDALLLCTIFHSRIVIPGHSRRTKY